MAKKSLPVAPASSPIRRSESIPNASGANAPAGATGRDSEPALLNVSVATSPERTDIVPLEASGVLGMGMGTAESKKTATALTPADSKTATRKTARTLTADRRKRPMLALLIAAHNETLVIERTLQSAIAAGMKPEDIYVVDDNSSDNTSALARAILGKSNVCRVRRSGKGLALTKAARKFHLAERYRWIHIADADGAFSPNYFPTFRRELRSSYVAATGYIKSLPGYSVSQYRVFEYTLGMEIHRRFQAFTHTVSVIPGPTSCFRSDIFDKLNFANHALCEDFDVTLQIHRQHLGKVQFIPEAIAYTQDPRNLHDFVHQITRWNRGVLQGFVRHKIGRRGNRIDAYLSYQVFQNMLFFLNFALLMPYVAVVRHSWIVVATMFLYDALFTFVLTLFAAWRSQRWDIVDAFPVIYFYRWVTLGVFLRAFVEVMVLRRFRLANAAWETGSRRYA